jgi:hypothetical protein
MTTKNELDIITFIRLFARLMESRIVSVGDDAIRLRITDFATLSMVFAEDCYTISVSAEIDGFEGEVVLQQINIPLVLNNMPANLPIVCPIDD